MIDLIRPTVDFLKIPVKDDSDIYTFVKSLLLKAEDPEELTKYKYSREEIISYGCSQALFLLDEQEEDDLYNAGYLICDLFDYLFRVSGTSLTEVVCQKLISQKTIVPGDETYELLNSEKALNYLKAMIESETIVKMIKILMNTCLDSFQENFVQVLLDKKELEEIFKGASAEEIERFIKEHSMQSEFLLKRHLDTNEYIIDRIHGLDEVLYDAFPTLKRKVVIKEPEYVEVNFVSSEQMDEIQNIKMEFNFESVN